MVMDIWSCGFRPIIVDYKLRVQKSVKINLVQLKGGTEIFTEQVSQSDFKTIQRIEKATITSPQQ